MCQYVAGRACTTGRKDHRNALHWAARNGHTEVCAWLFGSGIDLDVRHFLPCRLLACGRP